MLWRVHKDSVSQTSVENAALLDIALDILDVRQCSIGTHSIEVQVTILYKDLFGSPYRRAQYACMTPLT